MYKEFVLTCTTYQNVIIIESVVHVCVRVHQSSLCDKSLNSLSLMAGRGSSLMSVGMTLYRPSMYSNSTRWKREKTFVSLLNE